MWRYFSGDEAVDAGDRAWARRQAAEAQNHIFDRFVALLLSPHWLRIQTVLASVTDCASSQERMLSLFYPITSPDRRRLARFCMLVAQLTPHVHLGSFLRKTRALHMQRTSCLLLAAMKSCYAGWPNWTMPKRVPLGPEARMLGGGFVVRTSLVYSDNSRQLKVVFQMGRYVSLDRA